MRVLALCVFLAACAKKSDAPAPAPAPPPSSPTPAEPAPAPEPEEPAAVEGARSNANFTALITMANG